ncbi:MAG: sterol desaturase family protein, partial [Tagaea sp.]|nr:sterol desaturase family protein [Tagaea sp.]
MSGEAILRLGVFLGVLAAAALWEAWRPARPRKFTRAWRWSNNLALVVLDSLLVRLLLPGIAIGAALWAQTQGWGLLNLAQMPAWLAFAVAVVALDFAIWVQHVAVHKVPILWRLHRVHHADPDFDATTGLRFHPAEILLSALYKAALAILLGAPPEAVLVFEILLNAGALFTHANASLPPALDKAMRHVFVTPDMHRVHHSPDRVETDSNYGFNLAIWDRLFGTYREKAARGEIGLDRYGTRADQRLDRLLVQPLR